MLTVGSVRASLATIVSVIVSPAFARAESASFDDTIDTADSVGGVRSIITALLSSVATAVSPGLLAESSNAIDSDDTPSETSLATTVYVAVYSVKLGPGVSAPTPVIVSALFPAMLTVGSVRASLAAIVSVIVSPAFARAVSASFDDTIDTADSVGGVRSIVTALLSVTADRVTPGLLARSSNVIDRLDAPSTT